MLKCSIRPVSQNVIAGVQVSTILSSLTCELLPNPSSEWGYEADQDALQEVAGRCARGGKHAHRGAPGSGRALH